MLQVEPGGYRKCIPSREALMPFPLQGDLAELITRLNTVKSDDGSLDALVSDVLQRANSKALAVNRRAQWEYLLRREVFQHAVRFFVFWIYVGLG